MQVSCYCSKLLASCCANALSCHRISATVSSNSLSFSHLSFSLSVFNSVRTVWCTLARVGFRLQFAAACGETARANPLFLARSRACRFLYAVHLTRCFLVPCPIRHACASIRAGISPSFSIEPRCLSRGYLHSCALSRCPLNASLHPGCAHALIGPTLTLAPPRSERNYTKTRRRQLIL